MEPPADCIQLMKGIGAVVQAGMFYVILCHGNPPVRYLEIPKSRKRVTLCHTGS